jgi:hypothetical protein
MQRKAVSSSSFLPPLMLSTAPSPPSTREAMPVQPNVAVIPHLSAPIQFAAWETTQPALVLNKAEMTPAAPPKKTANKLESFQNKLWQRLHKLKVSAPSKNHPMPTTVSSPLLHPTLQKGTPEPDASFDEDWVMIATPEQNTLRELKISHENLRQQLRQLNHTDSFFPPIWTDNPNINIAIQDIQQENTALEALLTNTKILHVLISTRDDLIQQLKARPNYTPHFNYFVNAWLKLSDAEVDVDKAVYYTQKVNILLRLLLENTTVYRLFMALATERRSQVQVDDEFFIHSQAIHSLISLSLVSYLCISQPLSPQHRDQAHYKTLIQFGKGLAAAISFMSCAASTPEVSHLKDKQLWGAQSQLIISLLYQAQAEINLPFEILPLDELQDFSATLLTQSFVQVNEIEDPLILGPALYQMACWQHYLTVGYKQDAAVKRTPLEYVCKCIKEARQIDPAQGKWCQQYPDDPPIIAREKALCALFTQGLKATLALL